MALPLKAFGKMADFCTIKLIRGPVGFMFEAINFSQKLSPRPAVREGPPKASLQNVINSDQTPPIAARAPAV